MTIEVDVRGLRAGYGSVEVLHGVDMVIPGDSIVAVVGSNAAGKTTLLRCLAGLVVPRRGAIDWAGRDITHSSAFARADRGMVFVPDERNVFPSLTVRENLDLFARGRDIGAAIDVFASLGELLPRRVGTLSGGERQMVALSAAIVRPARLLLLDEPSRGLSPAMNSALYGHLTGLRRGGGTVVIVEQYLDDVLRVADFVYRLQRGDVVFAGQPGELAHVLPLPVD